MESLSKWKQTLAYKRFKEYICQMSLSCLAILIQVTQIWKEVERSLVLFHKHPNEHTVRMLSKQMLILSNPDHGALFLLEL